MTHQMYQVAIKRLYTFLIFLENEYNEPFNDNHYYIMQYYCVPEAFVTELVDTFD